jgi:protein TilB
LISRVKFELNDDDENIILNVWIFKHMDSSLVDVDVQPNYVRVTLKGKVLQLVFQENVKCDLSSAQRSQTTGELLIKMPKVLLLSFNCK